MNVYEDIKTRKVIVLSRYNALRLVEQDRSLNRAIVSISEFEDDCPNFAENPSILAIHYMAFLDVDTTDQKWCEKTMFMSTEQANELAEFVYDWWNKVDQIVVHCLAGASRSAGVAAAILKHFINDDSQIFNDEQYCPNMWCYRLTLEALEKYKNNLEQDRSNNNEY